MLEKPLRSEPHDLVSRETLMQLADKISMKKILEAFTLATGLTANIVDVYGKSIFSKNDAQKNCSFCQLIWQMQGESGKRRCEASYARAGRQSAIFGDPYIFRCPAGLVEWAAPIVIEGTHVGTIICGQVLMWEPEEFFWIELEEMNKELTADFSELFQAAKDLKVISAEQVQGSAYLLYVTANYIMQTGWENLRHRNELALQQSRLNEEIQNRKYLEGKLNSQSLSYSLEKEKELIANIKLGDVEKIKANFQVLLADIFMSSAGKLSVIKARLTELIIILSRAMVESGGNLDRSLELNALFLHEIESNNEIDEINHAATQVFERYLAEIQASNNTGNKSMNQGVKRYIRNNYQKNIILEEIASSVYLSPSYVSREFKKSQNISVMEYVMQVKVEEAKKLLRNPIYQVDEIAKNVGYSDAGYFSKVFRRVEGMSPTKFRQSS